MRPHTLRLQAFGPFGGQEVVDLDRLADAGLFLLSGPTGAGKTTVLDALCFALYGRVPGSRSTKGLRSQHAPADRPTEVELEVTVGGRRLRVLRRPEQERPKARGTGTTTDPASVRLSGLTDDRWEVLSTRPGEADQAVEDLVGLRPSEFFSVVLLPQGEFQRFLLAPAREREQLLATLFDVDRYERATEWLVEEKRRTAEALADVRRDVDEQATRAAEQAGVEVPLDVEGPWLDEEVARAAARADEAAVAHERARAADRDAVERLRRARDLADRQRRRRGLLAERDRLDALDAEVADAEAELRAARRAEPVRVLLDEAAVVGGRLERLADDDRRARADLPEDLRQAGDDDLRDAAARASARAEASADLVAVESGLDGRRGEVARLDRERAAANDELAAAAEELRVLPDARTRAEAERDRAVRARDGLAVAREALRVAADRREAVRLLVLNLQARAAVAARLERAADDRAAARERQREVREERVEGVRAELAGLLADDDECPVCGSLDHPNPAAFAGRRVTDADEQEADAELARREAAERECRTALATHDAEAARLRGRAHLDDAEQPDLPAAEVAHLEAVASVEETEVVAAGLDAARSALARLVRREAELVATRDAASAAVQRIASRTEVVAEALAADQERLTAARGGASSVTDVVEALRSSARAAMTAAAAASALDLQRDAVRRTRTRLAAALAATALDERSVRDALRPPDVVAALEERVTLHGQARAAVQRALASDELAVPLDVQPDVDAAAEAEDLARARSTVTATATSTATARLRRLKVLRDGLAAALERARPVQERAARVAGLAELTSGGGRENTRRMSLRTFVLAARLEQVVEAATGRLAAMTSGRFTLHHTDRRAQRGALSGLGLDVLDAWTGLPRPVSDLSGGQKFVASLALALGLADVVRAEAGGVRLDTLFVDEGFGSLDEELLETVMATLDELRAGGRLVGLVSHVSEMKQQIAAQVAVRTGPQGSSLALVGV